MLDKPLQCENFRLPDPGGFLVAISMRIVGMKFPRATFFSLILGGDIRMRSQIISKSNVALGIRRIGREKMKLHLANASFVGQSAITPSHNAQLTVPLIAKQFNTRTFPI